MHSQSKYTHLLKDFELSWYNRDGSTQADPLIRHGICLLARKLEPAKGKVVAIVKMADNVLQPRIVCVTRIFQITLK